MDWIEILLAACVPIVLIGGLLNRIFITHESKSGKPLRGRGLGWQFVRFSVLATGMPLVGLLTIKGIVTGEAAIAFFAAAAGYAFGKVDQS